MAKKKGKGELQHAQAAERILAGDATSVEFVFELEGELTDLSVFELVPRLQSMALALREANRTIFPQATDMRVGVKPIKEGSYEIHYVLPTRRSICRYSQRWPPVPPAA